MSSPQLHPAQLSVLTTLRHSIAARFSTLMQPTGLQSDSFKFHLRKLVHEGWVAKTTDGSYTLTIAGKEFANNLDHSREGLQKQPKLSMLIIVAEPGAHPKRRYLFQQRLRNPYYGFWSAIGGPVRWGESFEQAAQRELGKQTGLRANFTVHGFYRKRDYLQGEEILLEDKLFAVITAANLEGTLSHEWQHGRNAWMTLAEFQQQPAHFQSTTEAIAMVAGGQHFAAHDAHYRAEAY